MNRAVVWCSLIVTEGALAELWSWQISSYLRMSAQISILGEQQQSAMTQQTDTIKVQFLIQVHSLKPTILLEAAIYGTSRFRILKTVEKHTSLWVILFFFFDLIHILGYLIYDCACCVPLNQILWLVSHKLTVIMFEPSGCSR